MTTLGVKLEEYWKAIRHKKGFNTTVPMEDILLVYTHMQLQNISFLSFSIYNPCSLFNIKETS